MKPIVTTNCKKSAEVIVPDRLKTGWEGPNFRRCELMNATKDGFKDRQLHTEGYLQRVSAEQREHAEASAHPDCWTTTSSQIFRRTSPW